MMENVLMAQQEQVRVNYYLIIYMTFHSALIMFLNFRSVQVKDTFFDDHTHDHKKYASAIVA